MKGNNMKIIFRILIIAAIVMNIIYLAPALTVFHSITAYPSEWQAGIDVNSTIVWFVVITLGYGYLCILSLLAIFGIFFGFGRRKGAFRFLVLPGMTGIVLAIIWLVLFILFDAEWPTSWPVIAIPFVLPLVAYSAGLFARKKLIPPIRNK
jgi:hypothetical protein